MSSATLPVVEGDAALTEPQQAWRVRAALRAQDWKTVLAAIQALPPEDARDPSHMHFPTAT